MKTITALNVNHALPEGLWWLATAGKRTVSRNGPVVVSPCPVVTTYTYPRERVLFNAQRDANPYFHLMEALWMMAGRNDVAFPAHFIKRMREFSDDGQTLHGAYGKRWRSYFIVDQLQLIIKLLKRAPDSRRAVLQMWSAAADLSVAGQSKDVPCNTHAYAELREGELSLTVLCRSNDAIWGAHGANAVHFSVLQEYLACALNANMGKLYQFSNNYHVYTERFDVEELKLQYYPDDRYDTKLERYAQTYPLMRVEQPAWDEDLIRFMSDPGGDTVYHDPFFHEVAAPMYASWSAHRRGLPMQARATAEAIAAVDWRIACLEWLARRESNTSAEQSTREQSVS